MKMIHFVLCSFPQKLYFKEREILKSRRGFHAKPPTEQFLWMLGRWGQTKDIRTDPLTATLLETRPQNQWGKNQTWQGEAGVVSTGNFYREIPVAAKLLPVRPFQFNSVPVGEESGHRPLALHSAASPNQMMEPRLRKPTAPAPPPQPWLLTTHLP